MNVVVWIVSGILTALFFVAGVMELIMSKAELATDPAMGWASDLSSGLIKFIGVAGIAGALGLILPCLFDVASWLVPAAAIELALLMIGAALTHGRHHEISDVGANVVLLARAVFVAIERLGPERC